MRVEVQDRGVAAALTDRLHERPRHSVVASGKVETRLGAPVRRPARQRRADRKQTPEPAPAATTNETRGLTPRLIER
jgi:hypothetical protein